MCKGCLANKDIEKYCQYQQNIKRWKITGKSHEYIHAFLGMGCSVGKRRSYCCGVDNGGKSTKKGKGKQAFRNKNRKT